MQESFSAEHSSKLFRNSFEQFLNSSRVSNEGRGHFEATGRDVTDGRLDIVRDPFNKVGAVFVLDIEHLLIHFFHGHTASENGCHCQVAAVTRVAGGHHVLGIKHLLGQLRHTQCSEEKKIGSQKCIDICII